MTGILRGLGRGIQDITAGVQQGLPNAMNLMQQQQLSKERGDALAERVKEAARQQAEQQRRIQESILQAKTQSVEVELQRVNNDIEMYRTAEDREELDDAFKQRDGLYLQLDELGEQRVQVLSSGLAGAPSAEALPATPEPAAPIPTGEGTRLLDSMRLLKDRQTFDQTIDEAETTATKNGVGAGYARMETQLGRPLTPEERQRLSPLLLKVAPKMSEEDGLFAYLMGLEPGHRAGVVKGFTPGTREALLAAHGPELALPAPKDAILYRRGVEVEVPLMMLDRTSKMLTQEQYLSKLGPMVGHVTSRNPYDADAMEMKAHLLAAAQVVGKYMEGGVLRAEDIPKYAGMLPRMIDTVEVSIRKARNMRALLNATKIMYGLEGVPIEGEDGGVAFPNLPWNPASAQTPLNEIREWMVQNPDYRHGQELLDLYTRRFEAEGGE